MKIFKNMSFPSGHFNIFISIFILICFPVSKAFSQEKANYVLGDYTCPFTLPQKSIEISLNYLVINETIDILDFRDQEIETISQTYRSIALDDMNGAGMLVNYGLFDKTMLQLGYTYRNLDYMLRSMNLNSYSLSCKQAISVGNHPWIPIFSISSGVRFDFAYDLIGGDETEINTMLGRFPTGKLIVKQDNKDVYFYRSDDEYFVVPRSRNGVEKPAPQFSITDMDDRTWYLRLTAGKELPYIIPAIYVEYGFTSISSTIDTTLTAYIPDLPDSYKERIPDLPEDLSRTESYFKTGIGLTINIPYKTKVILGYDYVRFFRSSDLDYIDYNHIFLVDVRYNIIRNLDFVIGATMYHRQLNGVIPFVYNEYTQTTFDHTYGRANLGISYMFGR